jgi:hypothetical protein
MPALGIVEAFDAIEHVGFCFSPFTIFFASGAAAWNCRSSTLGGMILTMRSPGSAGRWGLRGSSRRRYLPHQTLYPVKANIEAFSLNTAPDGRAP